VRRDGRLLAWLGLAGALAAIAIGARAAGGKPDPDTFFHYSFLVSALIQYAVVVGLVLLIGRGLPRRDYLALRRPILPPLRTLGLAALALLAIYASLVVTALFVRPSEEQGLLPDGWNSHAVGPFVASVIAVTVVAPIAEELTYRGAGFALLRGYGERWAVLVTALLFALGHGLLEAFVPLVVFGVVVALLRSRTGSVLPGMLVHATFNGVAVAFSVLHAG
jgi:sodium transport system permease protein